MHMCLRCHLKRPKCLAARQVCAPQIAIEQMVPKSKITCFTNPHAPIFAAPNLANPFLPKVNIVGISVGCASALSCRPPHDNQLVIGRYARDDGARPILEQQRPA